LAEPLLLQHAAKGCNHSCIAPMKAYQFAWNQTTPHSAAQYEHHSGGHCHCSHLPRRRLHIPTN